MERGKSLRNLFVLQSFEVDVKYIGDDLDLKIWDEDVTSSDFVAGAVIKITALTANNGVDDWFPV